VRQLGTPAGAGSNRRGWVLTGSRQEDWLRSLGFGGVLRANVQCALEGDMRGTVETAQHDIGFHHVQRSAEGSHGDRCRQVHGVTIYTAADGWKRNRSQGMLPEELHRPGMAPGQELRFMLITTMPYRTNDMDHMACGQVEPGRQACVADRAAHARSYFRQCPTGLQQFWSGSAMNRAIDTAASEQAGVGRIDNGVHRKRGDVCPD